MGGGVKGVCVILSRGCVHQGCGGGEGGSCGKGVGVVKGWGAWGKYVVWWESRGGGCGSPGSRGSRVWVWGA